MDVTISQEAVKKMLDVLHQLEKRVIEMEQSWKEVMISYTNRTTQVEMHMAHIERKWEKLSVRIKGVERLALVNAQALWDRSTIEREKAAMKDRV